MVFTTSASVVRLKDPKGVTPRNHARDNHRMIKEMQKKNEEKKAAAEAATVKRSPRFSGVRSKVAEGISPDGSGGGDGGGGADVMG